jgi:hypothetical protein
VTRTWTRAFALVLPVLAAAAGAACRADAAPRQGANPQAVALREFGERADAYVKLREALARDVAPVSRADTAAHIEQHQAQLAAAVRAARKDARPGDIFTPPVVPQFRTIIRRDLQSRDIRDALAAMQDVPLTLSLRVNDAWPSETPRPMVPPKLLANLYPLPGGLEYRFLDRHLVLLDIETNLIVDFILDVVPSMVRNRRK